MAKQKNNQRRSSRIATKGQEGVSPQPTKKRPAETTDKPAIRRSEASPPKKPKSKVVSTPKTGNLDSFLKASTRTAPPNVWPFQTTDTFVMSKKYKEEPPRSLMDMSDDDEDTQSGDNKTKLSHLYASMLVSLPKNPEAPQPEAPLETIRRANEMLKPLMNKFAKKIWIAPWLKEDEQLEEKDFVSCLQADTDSLLLDKTEQYLHDFNRFQSWGRRAYMRLHILYHPSLQESQLLAQMSLCSIKGEGGQFFQQAHSSATDPISGGTLTGSVETMTESPDFYNTFKQKWNLKHLGLYWSFLRSKAAGNYTMKKNAVHIEIDRCDQHKINQIKDFFNQKSTAVTAQFWGTPMQWVPQWDFRLNDMDNDKVERNKESQYKLGMNLRSTTIYGTNLFNLTSTEPYKTLHQRLMETESIYNKFIETVTHDTNHHPTRGKKAFKGRLFYAIIPCAESQKATFYYTSANAEEASSVARALPRFIQSEFKLDASSFCTRELVADTRAGKWDATKRLYLSEEDVIEQDKLSAIDNSMMAVKEIFIDPSQQRALAADGDSIDLTADTRLTRGEKAAAPFHNNKSDTSTLTGSTRESKVKRAIQEVSLQHMETISNLQQQMKMMTEHFRSQGLDLPAALEVPQVSNRILPKPVTVIQVDDDEKLTDSEDESDSDATPQEKDEEKDTTSIAYKDDKGLNPDDQNASLNWSFSQDEEGDEHSVTENAKNPEPTTEGLSGGIIK